MSKEEKKAIENYKMFEDAIKQTISKGDRELYIDNLEAALRDTRILLSLIEKQQKELENSISKDKIREKIKELEEKTDKFIEENKFGSFMEAESGLRALKSIIEEE